MSEKTGGAVSYYLVQIDNPNQGDKAYQAECGDIIEALSMTFNEGNAFKAIWRTAAARSLGKHKQGGDALYDAEKVVFYGERMVSQLEFAMVKKQVKDIQACAKLDAEIFKTATSKMEWPNLDTVGTQQKPLFPEHHIKPQSPGVYLKIDDDGNIAGLIAVGSTPLTEPSAAMKDAMNGGLTDDACPYMCFPNNVCNKCGETHNGKAYRGGREAV